MSGGPGRGSQGAGRQLPRWNSPLSRFQPRVGARFRENCRNTALPDGAHTNQKPEGPLISRKRGGRGGDLLGAEVSAWKSAETQSDGTDQAPEVGRGDRGFHAMLEGKGAGTASAPRVPSPKHRLVKSVTDWNGTEGDPSKADQRAPQSGRRPSASTFTLNFQVRLHRADGGAGQNGVARRFYRPFRSSAGLGRFSGHGDGAAS